MDLEIRIFYNVLLTTSVILNQYYVGFNAWTMMRFMQGRVGLISCKLIKLVVLHLWSIHWVCMCNAGKTVNNSNCNFHKS